MDKKHRLTGFKALLEAHKSNGSYMEDFDDNRQLWQDLSYEGRLHWIVRDALLYNVPFEQFAEAVRESIDSTAIEQAALRLTMRIGRELFDLEKLFPDDGRTEPSPPLVVRVGELLQARSSKPDHDAVLTRITLSDLLRESRANEASARLEDSPWYGQNASEKSSDGKQRKQGSEKGDDRDIER
jgi:hypothetical protein